MEQTSTLNQRDNVATVLASGVVAYVGETLLHEGVGHGGACLLAGGHITLLAPLWMQCTINTALIVAAGPALNFVAGSVFLALIWLAPPRTAAFRQLLWLGFAFNALVACGYLIVGGASGFGDWGELFKAVTPAAAWRLPAVVVGLAGYYGALWLAAAGYRRLEGPAMLPRARLWSRTVLPAAGAAVVACSAEFIGGRTELGPLILALGCTLFVGLTLTQIARLDWSAAPQVTMGEPVAFHLGIVAAGLVVAVAFVVVIGPGLDLRALI